MTLLFDGCGLGVTLRHDDTAQVSAVFTRNVGPGFFALVVAKRDGAVVAARVQEDAPAVITHFDVAELGPTLGINANRGTQINFAVG